MNGLSLLISGSSSWRSGEVLTSVGTSLSNGLLRMARENLSRGLIIMFVSPMDDEEEDDKKDKGNEEATDVKEGG